LKKALPAAISPMNLAGMKENEVVSLGILVPFLDRLRK
jgi:hypothetical protein